MKEYLLFISQPGAAELIIIAALLAMVIFWIKTIIDIARATFASDSTKITWMLVVIFTGFIGALIYTFAGKPGRVRP